MKSKNFRIHFNASLLIGACLFLFISGSHLFPYVIDNGIGRVFGGGGTGVAGGTGDGFAADTAIETLVVEGAEYYLNASADIQSLLNLVETKDIKGIDLAAMKSLTESAILDINGAIRSYEQLLKAAEVTPYNKAVIDRLYRFDYYAYRLENGLNNDLFKEVEGYLKKGDIAGTIKKQYSNLMEIANLLNRIKGYLSQATLPDLALSWKLNEKLAETSLFGRYVSRVLYSI